MQLTAGTRRVFWLCSHFEFFPFRWQVHAPAPSGSRQPFARLSFMISACDMCNSEHLFEQPGIWTKDSTRHDSARGGNHAAI